METPHPPPARGASPEQQERAEALTSLVGLLRTLPFDSDTTPSRQPPDATASAHDAHGERREPRGDAFRLPPNAPLTQIGGYVCMWLFLVGGMLLGSLWVLLSGANLVVKSLALLGLLAGAYLVFVTLLVVFGLLIAVLRE